MQKGKKKKKKLSQEYIIHILLPFNHFIYSQTLFNLSHRCGKALYICTYI